MRNWAVFACLWCLAASSVRAQAPPDEVATVYPAAPSILPPDALGNRAWVSTEFLLWWMKRGPVDAPLVTTAPGPGPNAAKLSGPHAVVLGNECLDYGLQSGLRATFGLALDDAGIVGLEVSGFLLSNGVNHQLLVSPKPGQPILSRPVFDVLQNAESVYDISYPGSDFGYFELLSRSQLAGAEANLLGYGLGTEAFSLDILAGVRYLDLQEDLELRQHSTLVTPMSTFGTVAPKGSTLAIVDLFQTKSRFFGGQVGMRFDQKFGAWSASVAAKLALGVNHQSIKIAGASYLGQPGQGTIGQPAGILAVSSNSGRYESNDFSVVPELRLQLGYNVNANLRLFVGYDLIYWTNVVRPGQQIDRSVNPGLIPIDQMFGKTAGLIRPLVPFERCDFFAEGIHFGIDFRY